jgi:hypothetical protein
VQRGQLGCNGPIRHSRLRDADGIRVCRLDHAVEGSDTDGGLGLLTGQLASMEVGVEPNF